MHKLWLGLVSYIPKRLQYWVVIHAACATCPDWEMPGSMTAERMAKQLDNSLKIDAWTRKQLVAKVKKRFERKPLLNLLKIDVPLHLIGYEMDQIKPFMPQDEASRAAGAILDVLYEERGRRTFSDPRVRYAEVS